MRQLSNDITIRWRTKPFPHVVMDSLFSADFYALLCDEFQARLAKGLAPAFSRDKFWKFGHYDAYCWTFDPAGDAAFSDVFYSKPWRRFVNKFFSLRLTPNVIAEFHHHLPNSASGYVHNDYDIASFKKEPLENGLNPHTHQINYRGRVPGAIHCARSIAILYYFGNPDWAEGDGGETALYRDWKDGSEPVRKVAPLNNRLFAFEVSPKSYHGFLMNTKSVRNSMVMWYHSPEPYITARYGQPPK